MCVCIVSTGELLCPLAYFRDSAVVSHAHESSMSMRIIKSKNQCKKELESVCPSGSNKETEPRGGCEGKEKRKRESKRARFCR